MVWRHPADILSASAAVLFRSVSKVMLLEISESKIKMSMEPSCYGYIAVKD